MNDKNCIIIHGCPEKIEEKMDPKTRSYNKHWIPWTKKNLITKGIKTETPLMPTPWEPDYQKFKAEFENYAVDKNTILIGHSCGGVFLVRWLGETKRKVLKLILVAPGKLISKKGNLKESFRTYKIDETIKDRVKEIIMFTSNNESKIGKKSLEIFHEALGGKIISLDNHGHYVMRDMGTEEFPELIEEVIR